MVIFSCNGADRAKLSLVDGVVGKALRCLCTNGSFLLLEGIKVIDYENEFDVLCMMGSFFKTSEGVRFVSQVPASFSV